MCWLVAAGSKIRWFSWSWVFLEMSTSRSRSPSPILGSPMALGHQHLMQCDRRELARVRQEIQLAQDWKQIAYLCDTINHLNEKMIHFPLKTSRGRRRRRSCWWMWCPYMVPRLHWKELRRSKGTWDKKALSTSHAAKQTCNQAKIMLQTQSRGITIKHCQNAYISSAIRPWSLQATKHATQYQNMAKTWPKQNRAKACHNMPNHDKAIQINGKHPNHKASKKPRTGTHSSVLLLRPKSHGELSWFHSKAAGICIDTHKEVIINSSASRKMPWGQTQTPARSKI